MVVLLLCGSIVGSRVNAEFPLTTTPSGNRLPGLSQ